MTLVTMNAIKLAPEKYQAPLLDTMMYFKITNPAEFLGTVYYESDYLTNFTENFNFTCDALLKRFSRKRISYEDARRLARSGHSAYQEAIANRVYEGQWGKDHLGNYLPGDGWHYRGQGAIHLTGREQWRLFGEFLNRPDLADNPSIALEDPLLTCYTAGWLWSNHKNLNACGSDLRAITKKLTGASDTAIKTRMAYRDRVQELLTKL